MAHFMTKTVGAPTGDVWEAVLDAAVDIGLEAPAQHRHDGEVRLRGALNRTGGSQTLAVSVTDNGLGGSTLYLSWDDRFPARLTLRRMANRLFQRIRHLIG